MTMNFFKKVMTLFSTIWNAILWRKIDKKAKQAAKSAKEGNRAEDDSNPISETEKLFVDVPLNQPAECKELSEQEILISDETAASSAATVAHNIESRPDVDFGIKTYSSVVQNFGFEEETCKSLSFFSEPIRDDKESETPLLSSEDQNITTSELEAEQIPVSETDQTEPETVEEIRLKQLDEYCELQSSQELPTLLEIQPSLDNLKSSSTGHNTKCPKSRINPDLNYFAIGDEAHLFDHDDVTDMFLQKTDDCKNNETAQVVGNAQVAESDPISKHELSGMLETAEAVYEPNENSALSSSDVVPIGISVSSIQPTPETNEYDPDSSSKYSTNYMVKSDSLVNFLPEGDSDLDVNDVLDITDLLLETSKKSMGHEEGKEIPLLKEGRLEEIMCTPRGILKLSGTHHVDFTDENDAPKQNHVNTAVDNFLLDVFSFEEPLLRTHHLEGCTSEEITNESVITDDSPIFREVLKTVKSGLEDSESVRELDATTNDECATEPDSITWCRSIIPDCPKSPIMSNKCRTDMQNETPKFDQNENECRLSQFTTYHLDGKSDIGHLKRNDLLASGIPTTKYGELPSSSGPSDLAPSERETGSSHLAHESESNSIKLFAIDSPDNGDFVADPVWGVPRPMLDAHENSSKAKAMDESPHSEVFEDTNGFYPFIDCSSYLFRIPEEIRKETSFNPCVGAGPSRRSGYTNSTTHESPRFDEEYDGYKHKYPNVNSFLPNCVGTVPMVNPCIPEEYKNQQLARVLDGYDSGPASQNVGTFWGTHTGIAHPGQAIVSHRYPVSCNENDYEGEDLPVMSTVAYEQDQANLCSNSEGYGYINTYGAIEFPILSIPLCTPQPQSVFMPSGPLAPLSFPIGPFDVPQTEDLPSLVNLGATVQNEQYHFSHTWRGYPANTHLQNDEEVEMASMVAVRGLAAITENLSCTGTNEEDGDLDINPTPDPYLHLGDNNSLHTVKSKADSYSGSLFCDSIRSLISHTTENENIFPSFSCSSVQGCCPSVVLQSCETTLSNDSLPSIILEETNYSKSVDEDYLATEKFMNDVNTALNESVLDQIQGQVDLHSNLLGRGDGSIPMNSDQSEHGDHSEAAENDVMLRNSLGENLSINNSKLTLLDGVLGTDNGGSQPDPLQNLGELHGETSNSNQNYCRELLDSLVENVLTTLHDQSSAESQLENANTDADCGEKLVGAHLQASPERDLIVQNMMFIEGLPDHVRQIWSEGLRNKQENHEKNEKLISLGKAFHGIRISGENLEKASNNLVDTIVDDSQACAVDDISSRRGRRNRRRRKKLSDVEPEVEPVPLSEEHGISIGDGITAYQDRLKEPSVDKIEEGHPSTSKLEQILCEADDTKPEADGGLFANENPNIPPKCEQDSAQIVDEGDRHQEEDEGPEENSGNLTNNKRRRNRRRKRKN